MLLMKSLKLFVNRIPSLSSIHVVHVHNDGQGKMKGPVSGLDTKCCRANCICVTVTYGPHLP